MTNIINPNNPIETYQYNDHPIETIGFLEKVKCFTFFNYLSKLWMNLKFNLDKITININPNFYWLLPQLIDNYYFAIHSPKIIPEFKIGTNFIELKPGRTNRVTFSKINSNYEYNCYDYEKGDDIRSDCVTVCVMKKLQNDIGDLTSIINSFLLRKRIFQ